MTGMPHRHSPNHRLALGIGLLLVVVWGGNFTLQKHLFGLMGPPGFLFARFLIMPVCALALMRWRLGVWLPPVSRSDLRQLAWLGFLGHTLHVGMVIYGIHWSTAFSSSIILACGPVFTLLILRWQGLERLAPAQVLGVLVACGGVLMFLSDKLLGGHWRASGGDLFLLVAAGFFSWYTVAAKPAIERLGSVKTMGYATLLGSVPILLFSLPGADDVAWSSLSLWTWLGFFWSVVVAAFGGWLAWGWVNAVRGVASTAPLMYLMPPVAGVFAWVFTGEHYTWIKMAGAGVALLGVALAQYAGQLKALARVRP